MKHLLVTIPINKIELDINRFPDRNRSHIVEHLKIYCSKNDFLIDLLLEVEDDTIFLKGRHKFYEAAKSMGKIHVNAIIDHSNRFIDDDFIQKNGILIRDLHIEKEKYEALYRDKQWHEIYIFDDIKDDKVKERIRSVIIDYFGDEFKEKDLILFENNMVEVCVTFENLNRHSTLDYIRYIKKLNDECALISYNGKKYETTNPSFFKMYSKPIG